MEQCSHRDFVCSDATVIMEITNTDTALFYIKPSCVFNPVGTRTDFRPYTA